MKLSIAFVLLLAASVFSCVSASPIALDHFEAPLLDAHTLQERSTTYPVKSNDALIAKIMTTVKANLDANVFASISATVSDTVYIIGL